MSINEKTLIIIIMCICLLSCSTFKGVVMAGYVIDSRSIINIVVKEILEQGEIKIVIKANLLESAYSVSKIETNINGEILFIKAYKKYVMFVPKEKLTDEISLELIVPNSIKEIRFFGDNKSIWKRKGTSVNAQ